MVYLARSHKCLLTNDMGKDDFYDDLASFRNENVRNVNFFYNLLIIFGKAEAVLQRAILIIIRSRGLVKYKIHSSLILVYWLLNFWLLSFS